ncbi:hypothetical protein [Parabacteroides sp. PF5-9]|uniref:hypothetical protein n=1 Tax=Parabacteroides sp. PF5-9 TaxID=1742404 RepID=UPI0024732D5D|nr:hypothetical protein [Parabacteroides sp. PF5-9]MDH6358179.1 hypothetical protein [Parabacteroides sp. PF5-9]
MLLLNGTLTECPGLVYGKMGIAVFFFHYALDLIGEMQNFEDFDQRMVRAVMSDPSSYRC